MGEIVYILLIIIFALLTLIKYFEINIDFCDNGDVILWYTIKNNRKFKILTSYEDN